MHSGIILAGGKNLRIKLNKAFLKINNERIVDRIVSLFNNLFDEVIIVTNEPEEYADLDAKLVKDIIPGKASLGGIYSGLKHSGNLYNFIVACDMPFINKALIQYMQGIRGYDIVIPKIKDKYEALFAVYSKNCIPYIGEMIKKNRLKIIGLFDYAKVRFVEEETINNYDPRHLSFVNINTKKDLEKAREINETD